MTYAEKFVGYYLSFLLPTILFCCCPIVLWLGAKRYSTSPPQGSVFGTAMRILRQAMKGRWSLNPVTFYKNVSAPDFWESAKPSNFRGEARPTWMRFDDQWVDEVSRGFKACVVFLWFPIYCEFFHQKSDCRC